MRPAVLAFDVNETLLDLAALDAPFAEVLGVHALSLANRDAGTGHGPLGLPCRAPLVGCTLHGTALTLGASWR